MLSALIVEQQLNPKVPRVKLGFHPWPYGAERVKTLGTSPLSILCLEVSGSHIIETGVPQDVLTGFFFRHFHGCFSYHNRQLGFVVHSRTHGRHYDWVLGPEHAA